MKILLTGFDPFGGETVNPAFEAVKLLPDTIAGAEIVKQEVPTEFIRAGEVLEAAIQANQPMWSSASVRPAAAPPSPRKRWPST